MDVFSPVFSPDRSIFTDKTTSTVRGTPRLEHGTTPKVIWRLPWLEKEPPPSPIPKFWSSVLGPECKDAGPHCPATLASPVSIAERIKGSLAELPVFSSRSKPAITDPATPASKLVDMSGGPLTASELGRKIVAQIEVECPHCGYGTDPRTNKSSEFITIEIGYLAEIANSSVYPEWAMFVEWVKKLWENVKLGFTPRPEPEKTGA